MVFKPKKAIAKQEDEEEEVEEEPEEEIEEEVEEEEPKQKVEKPANGKQLSKQELIDIVEGNLNRAIAILQYLRQM